MNTVLIVLVVGDGSGTNFLPLFGKLFKSLTCTLETVSLFVVEKFTSRTIEVNKNKIIILAIIIIFQMWCCNEQSKNKVTQQIHIVRFLILDISVLIVYKQFSAFAFVRDLQKL